MIAKPLEGRVVVLTGASSGLGAQMARALDRSGARLALAARRVDRLDELCAELDDAVGLRCDVSVEDDRRNLIAEVAERFGRIDGLVNNAGITSVSRAMLESAEDFDRVIQTNLVGPYSLARHAAEKMKERGGVIVNVSSIAGFRATAALPAAAYTASKAGLLGLTRELATQWARYGIRVNALAPGFFSSEMTEGLLTNEGEPPEWLASLTPLGRVGRSGELDGALVYLLSDASSFMTGQTIVVDGGLTAR